MTTQERKKEKVPYIVRMLQVAFLWRHVKPLTMFGAMLGVAAFIQQNPVIYIIIPGLVIMGMLLVDAIYILLFDES